MFKQELSVALDGGQFLFPISDGLLHGRHRWDTRRHCHADYELHLLLDGTCSVHVENNTYALKSGDALLIAPGQYHQPLQISGDFQRLCLSFSVSPGELSQAIAEATGSCRVLPMDFRESAVGILRELSSASPFCSTLLHGYLEQLLVYLLRGLQIAPRSSYCLADAHWRTGVIDDYFETHITDGSEAKLAQLLHLSTRQLSRVLQRDYGMSFRQKRTGARMDYAGFLLRTTEQSISQICASVGYQSEAVFYRNFKEHFGTPPLQYRKQNKNP